MSGRPLPSSFDGDVDFYSENRFSKLLRRLKEEPLIPLGCALTCWALFKATRSIRSGDKATTNKMFRRRIYAQGFTLIAMLGGSYYYQDQRTAEKEVAERVKEDKAREKQNSWIKELEFRDKEDREIIERSKVLAERRRAAKMVLVQEGKPAVEEVVAEEGGKK